MGEKGWRGALWSTRWGNRLLGFGLPAAGAAALGGMAATGFNPVGVFPACLFLRLTGWRCPGCGSTFEQIAEKGKLGCAQCYDFFGEDVARMVLACCSGLLDYSAGQVLDADGGFALRRL